MRISYLLRRIGTSLLVLAGVSVVVFSIMQLIPGSPARVRLGVQATDETVAILERELGLDRPAIVQYADWISGIVLRGDFGRSLITDKPIGPEIRRRVGPTLTLAFAALLVGLAIALPLGIVSSLKPGGTRDLVAQLFSQFGVSVPDFWMGIVLVLIFAEILGVLPSSGYAAPSEGIGAWLRHLALPALTAGGISGAIMTRFVRSAMMDVLGQDHVRTARSKGLGEGTVLTRHVMRNAAITIATIVGLQMATLLSSVVVVEIIFSWPGLGSMALNATLLRDYPILQAAVLVSAVIFTVVNVVTDLSYTFLDPSIEMA